MSEPVSQRAREAAWPIWRWLHEPADRKHFMEGDEDEHLVLQAFARFEQQITAEAADVVEAARDLVMKPGGLRNNGEHLIVVEKADKSDPHYRLCAAFEKLDARFALNGGSNA